MLEHDLWSWCCNMYIFLWQESRQVHGHLSGIVYLAHQAHCKCKKLYSVTVSGEMTVTKGRRPPTFLSHTQASHVHARTIVYFHTIDAECHSLNLAALLTWLMHNNA